MTAAPPSGLPAHAASPGVPAAHGAHGGPPAAKAAQPKRSGAVRRFVIPLLVLAALGYGGKTAYDYFVEGRFLVSTDDAYVGASTSIIAAKATGHLTAVPVVDNQVVHQGDLLASIDDGDYQNAVDVGEGPHRHPGRDDRPLRPADRRAGRDHRPGRGPGPGVPGAAARRAGRRRAGLARIRPFAQARADEFRLAAAARTGDRRPRPHRRRARRRQGDRRFDRRRGRRRQGQSRRPQGPARRSEPPARRTRDGARQGRTRSVVHPRCRAVRRRRRQQGRRRSAISSSRARA